MKKQLLFFIFIVALCTVSAQERPSFTETRYANFTTDIQENLYAWRGNILDKYTTAGHLLYHHSVSQYGEITNVCASVPSKTLVFYQESGTIILLDQKLAPLGNPLNLFEHNLFTITLAGMSGTNQIALYDEANQTLLITDLSLNILNKTYCDFGPNFHPNQMEVNLDKKILLADSLSGVFIFDQYGTFDKRIAIPGIQQMQYFGNTLFFLKDNTLFGYTFPSLEMRTMKTSFKSSTFRIGKKQCFYIDSSGQLKIEPFIFE